MFKWIGEKVVVDKMYRQVPADCFSNRSLAHRKDPNIFPTDLAHNVCGYISTIGESYL